MDRLADHPRCAAAARRMIATAPRRLSIRVANIIGTTHTAQAGTRKILTAVA